MESSILTLSNRVREALHQIAGLIELVSEEPLSETQEQHLSRCRESADQLLRATHDLEELDRPEAVSRVVPFAIAGAVAEVAELMGVLASRKGLAFDWTVEGSVPHYIFGDKSLLQDTLLRLLDNSIRFTHAGSVRLSVTTISRSNDSAILSFEISDTGPGIDENILTGITSSDAMLPCLGLRIVRKRVAGLRGELTVRVNSASGATVRFTIPALIGGSDSKMNLSAEIQNHFASDGGRMAMLVAEDSDNSFQLLQVYTRAEGHRLSRAMNGAEAVEMVKSGDYDFIVMDVNMPVMDGYTATRLIREWETEQGRRRLPILLFSADDEERQIDMGAAVGCSGYLTKPATKAQVLAALNYYAQAALDSPGRAN